MMYQNQFVVAIKSANKVLRETKDLVQLPFGSEFSVLVKNLNSRRAKFKLFIDGTDVLDGEEIVVNANSEVEMKRFIRNGNMNEGNAFKFIERTQKIEDGPRGIKVDDGIVRVEFCFEQAAPQVTYTTTHHTHTWDYPYHRRWWEPTYGGTYTTTSASGSIADVKLGSPSASIARGMVDKSGDGLAQAMNATFSAAAATDTVSYNASVESTPTMDILPPANEAGITVPGSKIEQKFHTVYGFNPEANSHVIILRLVGRTASAPVAAPVTVKSKQKCVTCGKVNKATSRFCTDCGTSLELL
jgi:hypothetical protein